MKLKMSIVSFLLVAWFLSWFNVNALFVRAIKELFNKEVTDATYYFVFLCIGIIGEIILLFRGIYFFDV
jgi:hypothetical protein